MLADEMVGMMEPCSLGLVWFTVVIFDSSLNSSSMSSSRSLLFVLFKLGSYFYNVFITDGLFF